MAVRVSCGNCTPSVIPLGGCVRTPGAGGAGRAAGAAVRGNSHMTVPGSPEGGTFSQPWQPRDASWNLSVLGFTPFKLSRASGPSQDKAQSWSPTLIVTGARVAFPEHPVPAPCHRQSSGNRHSLSRSEEQTGPGPQASPSHFRSPQGPQGLSMW